MIFCNGEGKKPIILSEATICSLGLMIFAFFIHNKFPVRLISFGALLLSGFIISRNLKSVSDLMKITGENSSLRATVLVSASGVVLGIILSVLYRWHLDINIFPQSIHFFAITAALIGSTEELVFRGFIQEYVKRINGPFSVFFSTLSHTGYKCCLFLSPVVTTNIDIGFLAFYTFIVGFLFGTIRYLSKSLLPSLSAHALFDILVYAECISAPWWVW